MSRYLAWFSCGEASAAAAKLSVEKYGNECEVLYCDTFAYEHPDNKRFFNDVQDWLKVEIKILKSNTFTDIWDVFDKTNYLKGINGARCTTELKKNVRKNYQRIDDTHIFGFTKEEFKRIERFYEENPELLAEFPLWESGVSKRDCHLMLRRAGIAIPEMYRLGYKNNNCIGCVKGGKGYWNKIRNDFPLAFNRMAKKERELNFKLVRDYFLDEMPVDAGRYETEADIECGILCGTQHDEKPI
jgi:3'-phosphoadenosine 5'-phosphosulfate sulfotransferase (PAPS reductase)/FAD synthetase